MGLLGTVTGALSGGSGGSIRYHCRACGREFAFAPGVEDPDCPYCDDDVQPLE